jgi:hypothetical protein
LVRYIPYIPSFISSFIKKGYCFWQRTFLHLLRWSCVCCPCFLLCAILFFNLFLLSYPCIPGMKLTWVWCLTFLIPCWIWLASFYWEFFHVDSLRDSPIILFILSVSSFGMSIILNS